MSLTPFPHGIKVFGVPLLPDTSPNVVSGDVYWVGSIAGKNWMAGSNDTATAGQYETPFATVDYALGRCTANNGDVIYILPGHTETISTTTALALDVAGITVIGLGVGNQRPIFTVGTVATATITISANDVKVSNVIVKSNLDGLNTTITVTGARCELDIEHQDASSTVEADIAIAVTGDQFKCKLRDIGFAGGDQRDQSITLNGVDNARIDIDFYGKVGTAVVNMITVACTDVEVRGTMYVSGTTDGSKNVVDTITGSTWYMEVEDAAAGAKYTGGSAAAVASDDVSAINTKIGTITNTGGTATMGAILGDFANTTLISKLDVSAADATTNIDVADVVGNKVDAQVVAVGTTKSVIAYLKGLIVNTIVSAADTANNIAVNDVVGNKTDASVYVPGTTKALAAYAKGLADLQEKVVLKAAATMVNAQVLFTVAGGSILIGGLVSECVTANDATASTLQYSATPTVGAATTISGATTTLASVAAGYSISLLGTALSTVPALSVGGPNLGMTAPLVVPAGTITAVVGAGSTTGTWKHYLRYKPLATGVTVS